MKRRLAIAIAAAAASLVAAGTASATPTYDPSSQTGFISRGDVIAGGGKSALVPDPVIAFTSDTSYTLTCTWADSSQVSIPIVRSFYVLFRAEARYAANGKITGYAFSRADIFDGGEVPPLPDDLICSTLRPDETTAPTVSTGAVATSSSLTFNSPSGGFDLHF
jgi:hypothetical protein